MRRSNMMRLTPIAASSPSSTPKANTASTAATTTSRSRCHVKYVRNAPGRKVWPTAWMTMADSTGAGVSAMAGSRNATITSSAAAATQPDSFDTAPAASLADVAE